MSTVTLTHALRVEVLRIMTESCVYLESGTINSFQTKLMSYIIQEFIIQDILLQCTFYLCMQLCSYVLHCEKSCI